MRVDIGDKELFSNAVLKITRHTPKVENINGLTNYRF